MTEQGRDDKLNEALDALSSNGEPKTTGDPELNDLPRVAASLRGMPDPEAKERLRAELLWYLEIAKIEPGRARGGGWLPELRGWFSRTVATRRGRGVLTGSAFAAAAAALAIMFVAGVFSIPSELVRVPGVFASPSEQVRVEVPWGTTFQMTATKADAIGVDPDTDFALDSAEDLPADTVRALLHVEPTVELRVERESAGHYRISAGQRLEPGTVYRFLIEDPAAGTPQVLASFAFQTKTPVGVVQTIPRDQSTGVPINTGIELTFAQEGVQDIEGHFRIEPNVPGRFEVHKRVTVFVPQGELAPGTLYTVTVTRGLTVGGSAEVMTNDFVLQFETGEIGRTGEVPRRPILNFTRKTAESATSEAPALETYTWETGAVKLSVQVYRFDSMQGFLDSLEAYEGLPAWAGVTREAFVTDTTGLEQVTTFDADLQRLTESGKSFIQFPAPLPAGFYLVRSDFNHQPIQAWLQVTDVATYVTLAQDLTLVWVNDLNTQAPLAGARVEFIGADVSGETGGDGTLTLDTPGQTVQTRPIDSGYTSTEVRGNMLVTAPDGRVAVVPLSATANYYGYYTRSGQVAGDDYWHYLSTERPIYLPSDTIHFWGIARPRENPGIRTVTVQLTSYSYVGYDYQPVVVAEMEVETNGLGTFTGELPFAALSPDSYHLTISVDDQVIDQVYLQVQTYTKPAYQISVTLDKLAAFAGDEITFSIDATFLEGSPVPGLALNYSGSAAGQVTTDHNGHASVTVTAGEAKEPGDDATQTYLTVTPVRAEEGEIVGEAWVSVYPASVTASAQTDVDGDQGVITGTVHQVDLSRINAGRSKGYEDVLGNPAAGVTVSFDINDVSYRQTEIGEYYDFIAKIVRKQYRYDEVELPLGTFTAVTDADGAFRYTFPVDQEHYYRINMRVTDGQGRTEAQQRYVSGSQGKFNYASSYVYLARPGGTSSFYGGSDQLALGAPVLLAMYRGSDELPSGGVNRYLFLKAQDGVHDYAVQGESTYQFDFAEDDIPSVTVTGVWFNGRTYVEVNYGYQIRFNPAERGLHIEISPDQERYAPGDEARLDITVTDENGDRQQDTAVNISVVDEALFLIQGARSYTRDLLADMYVPVSPGILRTYASHQSPNDYAPPGFGATTGGGPRTHFADVAFYGSVTTDGDGHASISFRLPDNLTSWRVTAQGFNDRIMAGTALRQIPVGLPFFADVTLSDEYLVTDQPEVRLRSFGGALEAGDEVTFSVSAPSLGLDTPVEVTAPAFQAARVMLPELREGEHEVLIEARSGALEDSLVRKIRVVPSRLVSAQTRFYELQRGLRVEGSDSGPTRIAFSDHERGRYFGMLQQLTWGYGDRLDQMLARDVAAELLATFYDDIEVRGEPFEASIYQTPEGGIALFPYADQDLTLSARAAAVAPDRFGSAALMRHFLGVLQDRGETRERQVIALYGLAALGEPVLVPLQTLLKETDFTWRERLYAGLALVEVGDDTNAGAVYQGLIDDYGESTSPTYRLRVGEDQDDILEATSLAAILAAGLGDMRAPQLFDYTAENYTEDILVELEQISYLAKALPRLSSAPVRFAYTIDGERTEVALRRGESRTVQLTPEQLASLRLEPIEGAAGVASFYTGPIDPASVDVDPDVTVTRRYGTDPAALHEGELVQIILSAEFGPQALDGCYQLTDLLPSGLRPVVRPYAWGLSPGSNYPYRIDGQRVSFCVSDAPSNQGATYWARVVSTGEYTAEPALIQSMQSAQSINFSAADRMIIR
jgi:hypothetical protein